jgi:hypothetical protein
MAQVGLLSGNHQRQSSAKHDMPPAANMMGSHTTEVASTIMRAAWAWLLHKYRLNEVFR